jgi:hypothetical protein
MFDWLRRLLKNKHVDLGSTEDEAGKLERFLAALRDTGATEDEIELLRRIVADRRDTPCAPGSMHMLMNDFEARILQPPRGGASSSPISSP